MISKDSLVFDTTDAQSIADSDSIGAFIRSADGTLITHTTVGGKEALDVRVAEGINVEVDLDAADDSVAAWMNDGAGNAIGSTGGALHISDAGGSITVDATDLDIRALAFATDSVDVSGSSVSISGDVNVTQGTSPWVVSATDLDIRDLTAVSDSVQAWAHDGAGTALTSSLIGSFQALDVNVVASEELTVNDAALANTAIATAALTLAVANTPQDIVASPLANRKYLYIKNMSNQEMYIGASGVTAANGFPLSPSAIAELRLGAAVDIEFVGRTGQTPTIRTMELS